MIFGILMIVAIELYFCAIDVNKKSWLYICLAVIFGMLFTYDLLRPFI